MCFCKLVIILFLVTGINFNAAFAQSDTITINEVVVTADKKPILSNETTRLLEIVNHHEIETLPISNINDLLDALSGIDMRSRGFEGIQGDISIRGGNFDQVLILLDGINITDVQSGHHNLNLPVSFNDIQRIEILKGGGARLWGPNAYSGAINIITKPSANNSLNLAFENGSKQFVAPYLAVSNTFKNYSHYTSFSGSSSKGYTENTDFMVHSVFHKSSLNYKRINCQLSAGHSDKQFGANSFYTPLFPEQFEHIRSSFASLSSTYNTKSIVLDAATYFKRHQDRFELFRNNHPLWYQSHNYHLTIIKGFKIKSSYFSKFGKSNLGLECREEEIFSTVLGKPLAQNKQVPYESKVVFTQGAYRQRMSLFFEQFIYLGKRIELTGGLLCDYDKHLFWNCYPGIDIRYMLVKKKMDVFASYNKSLRLPTFTDLYYKSPTQKGNPELKAEKSNSCETGFKLYLHHLYIRGSAFINKGSNIIDWVKLPDTALWQSMNITELNTYGYELSSKLSIPQHWHIPLRLFSVSYTYIDVQKSTGNQSSLYALDFLKHKISLSLDITLRKNVFANVSSRWQDRNGMYDRFDKNTQTFEGQTEHIPFSTTDIKIYWQKNHFQIFTECLNIFNTQYADFGNIPMPGRMYRWGVKAEIHLKKQSN